MLSSSEIQAGSCLGEAWGFTLVAVGVHFLFMVSGTLMEPKPGLGRTEPVSHRTFSNHKTEHAA